MFKLVQEIDFEPIFSLEKYACPSEPPENLPKFCTRKNTLPNLNDCR